MFCFISKRAPARPEENNLIFVASQCTFFILESAKVLFWPILWFFAYQTSNILQLNTKQTME